MELKDTSAFCHSEAERSLRPSLLGRPAKAGFRMTRLSNRGQTAAELAIFGAILMFVIGVIVRTAMGSSQVMNQQLKAMRMAMSQSYLSTMALGKGGNTSRNVGNILIIEDRLSLDPNSKLGTRERIPLINTGNATFSNQLFQPTNWGTTANLAVFDVFINGQRFPLTSAGFKQYTFNSSHPNWDPDCYHQVGTDIRGGCLRAYKVVGNYDASPNWCAGPVCNKNLPPDERFDLDVALGKNIPGVNDNPGYGTPNVPVSIPGDNAFRTHFEWQWFLTPAITKDSFAWLHNSLKDNWGDPSGAKLPSIGEFKKGDVYDVDADGKEEIIHDFDCNGIKNSGVDNRGVITCMRVTDSQAGDVDFTINDRDKARGALTSGLQDDVQMFSFTKGVGGGPAGNENGTYLRVEEGRLFDPASGRFVRNTTRQNHVDIIQRIFRLSNDTGRFCNGSTPTATVGGYPNNVEACITGLDGVNCFSETNVAKTCMDTVQKLIFIRSRIQDLRGRRWVTKGLE